MRRSGLVLPVSHWHRFTLSPPLAKPHERPLLKYQVVPLAWCAMATPAQAAPANGKSTSARGAQASAASVVSPALRQASIRLALGHMACTCAVLGMLSL